MKAPCSRLAPYSRLFGGPFKQVLHKTRWITRDEVGDHPTLVQITVSCCRRQCFGRPGRTYTRHRGSIYTVPLSQREFRRSWREMSPEKGRWAQGPPQPDIREPGWSARPNRPPRHRWRSGPEPCELGMKGRSLSQRHHIRQSGSLGALLLGLDPKPVRLFLYRRPPPFHRSLERIANRDRPHE